MLLSLFASLNSSNHLHLTLDKNHSFAQAVGCHTQPRSANLKTMEALLSIMVINHENIAAMQIRDNDKPAHVIVVCDSDVPDMENPAFMYDGTFQYALSANPHHNDNQVQKLNDGEGPFVLIPPGKSLCKNILAEPDVFKMQDFL